jgi:hypothetical protein
MRGLLDTVYKRKCCGAMRGGGWCGLVKGERGFNTEATEEEHRGHRDKKAA